MRRFGEFTGAVTCRKAADHIVPSTSSDVLKKLAEFISDTSPRIFDWTFGQICLLFLGAAQLYHEISNSEQARFWYSSFTLRPINPLPPLQGSFTWTRLVSYSKKLLFHLLMRVSNDRTVNLLHLCWVHRFIQVLLEYLGDINFNVCSFLDFADVSRRSLRVLVLCRVSRLISCCC